VNLFSYYKATTRPTLAHYILYSLSFRVHHFRVITPLAISLQLLDIFSFFSSQCSFAHTAVSTVTMGKAMGTGSSIGRASAGAIPRPNPMGASRGMGMGPSVSVGAGYGGGMGMNRYGNGNENGDEPTAGRDGDEPTTDEYIYMVRESIPVR
jgi:hypothetical protein